MNFSVFDFPQRSAEWFAIRAGKLTGSRAADMLATVKSGGEAAGRRNLRAQLVLERLTGKPQERGFVSQAMQDGIDREADAYAAYEAITGRLLSRTGFCLHDELAAGASLDGHVGDFEGLIEIKSPMPATHLDYLESGVVPDAYAKQILHALWLTGAQWCDWMSYHPDFPAHLQAKVVRVERNEAAIDDYETQVRKFLAEVEARVLAVSRMVA